MDDTVTKIETTYLKELHDLKNTIRNNLSSQGRELCWNNETIAEKENAKNLSVVNDVFTDEVEYDENIKLMHAGNVSTCRKNGDFSSGFKKIKKLHDDFIIFYYSLLCLF